METPLITRADMVGQYIQISEYAQTEKLNGAIMQAQRGYLQPLLGRTLYELLFTEVSARITALKAALVPFLAWSSYLVYKATSSGMDTQSGLRRKIDDYSEPISATEFAAFRSHANSMIASGKNDLIIYLNNNAATYPEYQTACGTSSQQTGVQISAARANRAQERRFQNRYFPLR